MTGREGEERKLVTVLFADLVGSTGLGERLDAERLRDVMSSFFAAMREEIQGEGGSVEKFIGDAVMAVFGIPAAHEDDAIRALRAALRMRSRLEMLNDSLGPDHGVRLEMRIGVNSGEVVVGLGAAADLGRVTGDAVNVAARIEQAAQPGQILVSDRTARASRGFEFREIGPLPVKGRERSVIVFELLEAGAPRRGIPGLEAPLVGRAEELKLLSALYERVRAEGKPHLVTVYGPAGVGKSRLVSEFIDRLEMGDRPAVVQGRCLSHGQEVTYWPLAEILKAEAGVLDTDPSEVALEKIHKAGTEMLGADLSPDPRRSVAALAYTIGLEDPEVSFSDLSPRQVRLETHLAWRAFFTVLGSEHPLVAVIEDIHWAESALLDLLEELADRVQAPILMISTARPELVERRPAWGGGKPNFSAMFLEPLSEDESRLLVGLLLEIEELPEEVRSQILARAEGNPFFLEEIIRQLIDEGVLERAGARWRATGEFGGLQIPDTVQGVLAARMDLLGEVEKRALQCAAVVGRTFWSGAIEYLIGEAIPVTEVLDTLEDRGLTVSRLGSSLAGQQEYLFKHILTREVAYESIPYRERAVLHGHVGSWMEATARQRKGELIELLAHHYWEALQAAGQSGQETDLPREKAFRYLLLAARDATRRLVTSAGRRFAERALTLAVTPLEKADALEALGAVYQLDYQGDDGWRSLRAAVEERLAAGDEPEAIARTTAVAVEVPIRWPGSMRSVPPEEEVARYLELGLAHMGEEDSEPAARLLGYKAAWPWAFPDSSRFGEAELREAAEAAAGMARRLGRPEVESAVLDLGNALDFSMGKYASLLPLIQRRLELAEVVQDPWETGDIFAMAGFIHYHLGLFRNAREYGDEGYRRNRSLVPGVALHCVSWRGLARHALGDWDGLLEDLVVIEELLGDRRSNPPYFAARPFAAAALVHDIRGDRAAADRLLAILESLGEAERHVVAAWPAWLGPLYARRGNLTKARRMLEVGNPGHNLGLFLQAWCEVIAEGQAWDEAPGIIEQSRRHAREAGLLALPAHADRLEGQMGLALGEPAGAVHLLQRAAEQFDELEACWETAATELSLAEALLASGETEAARHALEECIPVFERLGARRELDRSRDLLDAGLQADPGQSSARA